jgi:signal transduction histidine kinase
VKNLLQSLNSLCAAVQSADDADASSPIRQLIQRQLPQVTQRLQRTLDKLNHGHVVGAETVHAGEWWRALQQRYGHESVRFGAIAVPLDAELPVDLFDSVADNLLQNALTKRRSGKQIIVRAQLTWDNGCVLRVCDDGMRLAEHLVRRLFTAPVASAHGFGVGLYQAARQAQANGHRLLLATNRSGEVCFELRPLRAISPRLPAG